MLKDVLLPLEKILPESPEIKRLDLFDDDIFDYLEANFQEFSIETIYDLFDAFGFNYEELTVFFNNEKAGLFAMQVPFFKRAVTHINASATFAWHLDEKSGNKVFSISGISGKGKDKHVIAARYEASPDDENYQLKNFDIGIPSKHQLSEDVQQLGLRDIMEQPTAGIITKQMIKMTGNTKKFSLPSKENIFDFYIKGRYFPRVPSHLQVVRIQQPVK